MLAKNWQLGASPAAYLVSEKLDGVRALWDGRVLRFRSGRPIAAPDWFLAALPSTALDGELWLGRGQFDRLSGAVRRNVPVDAEWRDIRYMIFDLPAGAGPFAERLERLAGLLSAQAVPWLQKIEQVQLPSAAELQQRLQGVADLGGEGLMLHRADALWSAGRSDTLRKLKPMPDDEARVVGYEPGKGRLAGGVGALLLEMDSGRRFSLGTGLSDADRKTPPALGELVTYRYRGLTPSGLPRFASFVRQRPEE
ncbi:ATP-dependent DNA ligase [Comamonadaceae bacterium]|nr:ATP-dependent DNA ligase [Comamonadaceae bacterium]